MEQREILFAEWAREKCKKSNADAGIEWDSHAGIEYKLIEKIRKMLNVIVGEFIKNNGINHEGFFGQPVIVDEEEMVMNWLKEAEEEKEKLRNIQKEIEKYEKKIKELEQRDDKYSIKDQESTERKIEHKKEHVKRLKKKKENIERRIGKEKKEFNILTEAEKDVFDCIYRLFNDVDKNYAAIKKDEWEKIPLPDRQELYKKLENAFGERHVKWDWKLLQVKIFTPEIYRVFRDLCLVEQNLLAVNGEEFSEYSKEFKKLGNLCDALNKKYFKKQKELDKESEELDKESEELDEESEELGEKFDKIFNERALEMIKKAYVGRKVCFFEENYFDLIDMYDFMSNNDKNLCR